MAFEMPIRTRARAKRSNCVGMKRFGPMKGSNTHREWEFSVTIARLTASRTGHIVAASQKAFDFPVLDTPRSI